MEFCNKLQKVTHKIKEVITTFKKKCAEQNFINVFTTDEHTREYQLQVLQTFKKTGGDINMLLQGKQTALHWAVSNKNEFLAAALLVCGADANIKNTVTEKTPLHYCFLHPYNSQREKTKSMIKLLLHYGADPNQPDIQGITPTMLAVEGVSNSLVRIFFRAEGAITQYQAATIVQNSPANNPILLPILQRVSCICEFHVCTQEALAERKKRALTMLCCLKKFCCLNKLIFPQELRQEIMAHAPFLFYHPKQVARVLLYADLNTVRSVIAKTPISLLPGSIKTMQEKNSEKLALISKEIFLDSDVIATRIN
jgi:hypothetical protein